MKRWIVPGVVSLLGIAVVVLLIFGITHQGTSRILDQEVQKHEQPPAPNAGQMLPSLNDGSGSKSLASFHGKAVLLNFWASWCPPCQEEAPLMQATQKVLTQHDGTVLGVTYQDAAPDSLSFIHEHALTYPNLRDVTGSFAHSYGTDQLPESFMINREGKIVAISRGEVTKGWLANALRLADA
jgi:cytochrome c biogenesis protein CcmG, thiol:disulfide interchange protein DsbE